MNCQPASLLLSESPADPIFTAAERNGVVVMLVAGGTVFTEIDGHSYRLGERHVVTLFPSHTLMVQWQSDDAACVWCWFPFDFLADFPLLLPPESAERFGARPIYRFSEPDFATLKRAFDTLAGYYTAKEHPSRQNLLKAQLFIFVSELLYRCTGCAVEVRVRRSEMLTDAFFALLHRHYSTERTLAFYADRLCITTKYLSKVIRRTTGHTVYFWIEEFVTKEARRLLRSTDDTVTEIAERLYFPNSSFFAKFFRRHTGLSPVEYRNRREPSGSSRE